MIVSSTETVPVPALDRLLPWAEEVDASVLLRNDAELLPLANNAPPRPVASSPSLPEMVLLVTVTLAS